MTKPIHRPPLARLAALLAALLAAAALLALCAGCKTELDDGGFSDGFTARSACAYIAMLQESGTVKVTGTLTEDDLTALENAINGAADGVLVSLDLSNATASSNNIRISFCDKLRSIAFPRGCTEVHFGDCDALESVIIPNGVTKLSGPYRCSSLTSLTIPDSVTEIYAPGPALESVTFKATSGWKVSSLTGSTTTALSSADLADPKIAARYLRTTYLNYWWTRSDE